MKRLIVLLALVSLLALPALVLGEGAVLMVELPEDAQIIENVEFEDGDFIQTYQLDQGVTVQLLRYATLGMTLEEMARGEWNGYQNEEKLELAEIDGYPAQGVRFDYEEEENLVTVYLMMVDVQEQSLIFQAIFPENVDAAQIESDMGEWFNAMKVYDPTETEVG